MAMRRDYRMLCGPLAAVILLGSIAGFAQVLPEYSSVRQTVSEIYEEGSPLRVPFGLLMGVVGVCIWLFATGLRRASLERGYSAANAYLTMAFALSAFGLAAFAYPHPLHNFFGQSELVGYQAPLVMAFTWRHERERRAVAVFSAIMAVAVWAALLLNMSVLDRSGALYQFEKPFYGLVQRLLFVSWGLWSAGTGLLLFLSPRNAVRNPLVQDLNAP